MGSRPPSATVFSESRLVRRFKQLKILSHYGYAIVNVCFHFGLAAVGNIAFDVSEQALQEMFSAIGPIKSLRLVGCQRGRISLIWGGPLVCRPAPRSWQHACCALLGKQKALEPLSCPNLQASH